MTIKTIVIMSDFISELKLHIYTIKLALRTCRMSLCKHGQAYNCNKGYKLLNIVYIAKQVIMNIVT